MKYVLLLLLVVSCGDCNHKELMDKISYLEQENDMIRSAYSRPVYNYCPPVPACLEDKIEQGCMLFKIHLAAKGVKLELDSWNFCDKYKGK